MSDSTVLRWAHPAVILVATDLTDLDELMPLAVQEAANSGARLILLHVLASSTTFGMDAEGLPFYDTVSALELADRTLQPWCVMARRANVSCDALVREGNAALQVAAAVRQFQVDRVLVGTRSRSKLSKLLLGSVAEQVLRSVNIPVMTVGPEAHLPAGVGDERIVLHATTFRETSRPSAALACQIAVNEHATLVLLHILPPDTEMKRKGIPTALEAAAAHALSIFASELSAGCDCVVEPVVIHGNPSIEILAEAYARHAGLIVLGATHRSALENLTHDRTVYRVVAHSQCPVLTLREIPVVAEERYAESTAVFHG